MERRCGRNGCTTTRYSDIGMEFHLLRDHDLLGTLGGGR